MNEGVPNLRDDAAVPIVGLYFNPAQTIEPTTYLSCEVLCWFYKVEKTQAQLILIGVRKGGNPQGRKINRFRSKGCRSSHFLATFLVE
ncbi:hypothetical protein THAOC_27298 [Thalassiosira oceanica]|uniref:Uncharacterized protein n=1 Tax=Thalassiosira oceanica TaxID=159749 RepID=K0RJ86_THAOC|nr:hypothetical protein THAOC_27298 [Thalassiosira oceanica]|eukprot:EJK53285.1 hypothetical protein THAOC_27298 [Thalassiosira oceanica]